VRLSASLLVSAFAVFLLAPAATAQRADTAAAERFPGITVTYEQVRNPGGFAQRLVVTAPAGARGPLPAVLVAGWLSCDPVQMPGGPGTTGSCG
jgi:hypothetical protein